MVTISIAERGDAITSLLRQMLLAKGFRFCRSKSGGDGDYLLLPCGSSTSCDVLLLHEPDCRPVSPADYITIVNADGGSLPPVDNGSLIITYGLNSLATVTASSLHTDHEATRFLCCLQRSIVTLKGKVLEPQEFPVFLPAGPAETCAAMGLVTLGLVLSLNPEDFNTLKTT